MAKDNKSKMVKCKHCGAEIAVSVKDCPQCGGKNKKPIYKRPWFIILILVIVRGIIGSAGGGDDKKKDVKPTSKNTEITENIETETQKETKEDLSMSQKQAVKSAETYLATMAFSRQGLIDQLSSEYGSNYPVEDAEWAVNYLEEKGKIDWNEQAIKAAKTYLDTMAFSKQDLIDQLASEHGSQFTKEQAEYAVNEVYK